MKRINLSYVLCLFINITCLAQFPSPRSFTIVTNYIALGDSDDCGKKYVHGPAYCTTFQWEAPDLSETQSQLTGYNIYCYYYEECRDGVEVPFSEAEIIAQTTDTYLQMEFGSGIVWVTAVYQSPEGESAPSNIQCNDALPIAIQPVEKQPFTLIYNEQKNGIEIQGIENIASLRMVRLDGSIMLPVSSSDFHFIDTKGIEKGVYIVEIITKDANVITEKLVIK